MFLGTRGVHNCRLFVDLADFVCCHLHLRLPLSLAAEDHVGRRPLQAADKAKDRNGLASHDGCSLASVASLSSRSRFLLPVPSQLGRGWSLELLMYDVFDLVTECAARAWPVVACAPGVEADLARDEVRILF